MQYAHDERLQVEVSFIRETFERFNVSNVHVKKVLEIKRKTCDNKIARQNQHEI